MLREQSEIVLIEMKRHRKFVRGSCQGACRRSRERDESKINGVQCYLIRREIGISQECGLVLASSVLTQIPNNFTELSSDSVDHVLSFCLRVFFFFFFFFFGSRLHGLGNFLEEEWVLLDENFGAYLGKLDI